MSCLWQHQDVAVLISQLNVERPVRECVILYVYAVELRVIRLPANGEAIRHRGTVDGPHERYTATVGVVVIEAIRQCEVG